MRTDIIATALILVSINLLYRHRMKLCGSLCVWMAVLGPVVGGEGLDLDRAVIVGSAALILERSHNHVGSSLHNTLSSETFLLGKHVLLKYYQS